MGSAIFQRAICRSRSGYVLGRRRGKDEGPTTIKTWEKRNDISAGREGCMSMAPSERHRQEIHGERLASND